MGKLRVGVLFGGKSVEHEVSVVTARAVIAALDLAKYEVVPLGITRDGGWLAPERSQHMLVAGSTGGGEGDQASTLVTVENRGLTPLTGLDVVFPLVHGTMGEDGTLQGLLELAGLPYVGAGVLGSAVGMDKDMMKRVFRDYGLPVGPFLVLRRSDWADSRSRWTSRIAAELGFPCFVKPSNGGSSVGISKVNGPDALPAALELALTLDRKAVVEQAIDAHELECAVLGNEHPEASVVGEVRSAREFYDYEAKYFDNRTTLTIPADVPATVSERVRAMAVQVFQAVDCEGMARVDFFWREADSALFVNEINTIPGFTPMSMYPRMWQASGMSYPALVDRLIQLALQRHREKQTTQFSVDALAPEHTQ